MLFMVIETFKEHEVQRIYRRLEERGRMMPDGLRHIESWIEVGLRRCFQLMACEDARLLQEWITNWNDLMAFEVVPVLPSTDTADVMRAHLRGDIADRIPP